MLPAIVPDFIILVLSTWSICIRWGTTKEAFSLGNKKNKSSTFFCGCWSIRIDHPKTWNAVVVTHRCWKDLRKPSEGGLSEQRDCDKKAGTQKEANVEIQNC